MPRLKEGVQWVGVVWAAGALCTEEEEACRCRWRTLCAEQGGRTAGTFTGAQQRSPWGWKQTQARSSTEVSKVGKAWTMAWLLQPNPRIWDKSLYLSQRGRLSFTCSCSSPKPYSPVQETGWESGTGQLSNVRQWVKAAIGGMRRDRKPKGHSHHLQTS